MYYGVMMVKMGDADGLVSGAIHSTGDMLRPALQIIKSKPGIKTVSSCFLMECPNKAYGDDGVMVFADCAVNIDPDAEQLASIAPGRGGQRPRAGGHRAARGHALLLHQGLGQARSGHQGAGSHPHRQGARPQPDAGRRVAAGRGHRRKRRPAQGAPAAPWPARPNVLVFPGVEAGNIGLQAGAASGAGAEGLRPILQGIAKPCNDLSRGCSVDDIVATVAITAAQA